MMPDHRNFASYYGNTLYPVYRLGHIRHHTHAGNYKDTPSNRVLQRRTAMDTFFPLLQIILKTVWTDDIPVRCIISIGFYLVAGPRLSGSDRRQVRWPHVLSVRAVYRSSRHTHPQEILWPVGWHLSVCRKI